jgi:ribosomal protein L11 methyltransferase
METIYSALNIKVAQEHYEIVIGCLSQLPFESFFEDEHQLVSYFVKDSIEQSDIDSCLGHIKGIEPISYKVETIENKNWNEEWESSFEPVVIDDKVCIRADFHPSHADVEHDIIVNPKMAFGTAHHETTYMMMQSMLDLDLEGKKILDYGCGTSILAILAAKKEAGSIIANDYDINSVTNSQENIELNKVSGIEVRHGELDIIEERHFDLILANINRHVLLENAFDLHSLLVENGILLMSGILHTDKALIEEAYLQYFNLESSQQKGEWMCFKFSKK